MISDASALHFEIPARDALGHQHVIGKLSAAEDALVLYWRLKSRTFRPSAEDMRAIRIDYGAVEAVALKTTLGFFKPRLTLRLKDPNLLQGMPGTDVGSVTVHLSGGHAKAEAAKFIKMVDYRKSEAEARRSMERLSDLKSGDSF